MRDSLSYANGVRGAMLEYIEVDALMLPDLSGEIPTCILSMEALE